MEENIAENKIYFMSRANPEKYTSYKIDGEGPNHLTKVKRVKDYEYYYCDYCHDKIRILDKQESKNIIASGGIIELPQSLTRTPKKIKLALCSKCLRTVVQQFTDKNMLEDNERHIPRID